MFRSHDAGLRDGICPGADPSPETAAASAGLPATDIKSFMDELTKDRVTDAPIRVTDAGGYKVGVYGVFRPKAVVQASNRHETTIPEITTCWKARRRS